MAREPIIEVLFRAENGVGESLRWIAEDGALLWTDITGKIIQRLELNSGRRQQWKTPGFPAAIVPTRNGQAVVAVDNWVARFDFGDRFETFVTPEPDLPDNQLNEAAVDPNGRLWVGTMQNNIHPDGSPKPISGQKGSLYVIEPSGECRRACDEKFGITNTLAWRGRALITADTVAEKLYVYDYDPESGRIDNRQVFSAEPGYPDGSCLDEDGYLWNARFGGGRLVRFDPTGRVDRIVELPVRNPTSCCFGGDRLQTLFVTSARFGLAPEHIAANPDEGSLLALDVGCRGAETHRFAG